MKFIKIVFTCILAITCVLITQSCTTETKANQAERTPSKLNIKDNGAKISDVNAIESKSKLTWYDIEEIEKLQTQNPKKVIVDVYTNWCRWCKIMDQKTFTDPNLIKYLNENYYMVKFNAELNKEVTFKGEKYQYIKSEKRGLNTLAAELIKGSLSYPSFVVLDEELNHLHVTRGYKNAIEFKQTLENLKAI